MFGLVTGALGLAGSAVQLFQGISKGREAKKAAEAGFKKAMGTKNVDKTSALQSPDIRKLSQDATARNTAASVQAIKDLGPEGAANIAGIYQQALSSDLEAGQAQAQQDFMTDRIIAANKQELANQEYEKQLDLHTGTILGAQAAAADASEMTTAAMGGLATSAGLIGEGIIDLRGEDE
jgi:hypothetical protein